MKKGAKKKKSGSASSGERAKPKLSAKERKRRSNDMKRRMAGGRGLLSKAQLARKKAGKKAAKKNPVVARPMANPVKAKKKKKKAKKNPITRAPAASAVPAGIVYEAQENPMKAKKKKGKKKAKRNPVAASNPVGKGPAKSKASKKAKKSGSRPKKKKISVTQGSPINVKGTTKRKINGKPMVLNTNIRLVMGKAVSAGKKKKASSSTKKKKKASGKKKGKKLSAAQKKRRQEKAVLYALQHNETHRAKMLAHAAENPVGMILGATENPLSWSEFATAGVIAVFGYAATDFLDRYLATTDPTAATYANLPIGQKNASVLAGPPGITRILAQLGVTVVGVVGSAMFHRSTTTAGRFGEAASQGLAIGSIVHLGAQLWTHYVMAKLLWNNVAIGERMYSSEIVAATLVDPTLTAPTWPGGIGMAAPRMISGPMGRTPYGAPRVVRGVGDTTSSTVVTPATATMPATSTTTTTTTNPASGLVPGGGDSGCGCSCGGSPYTSGTPGTPGMPIPGSIQSAFAPCPVHGAGDMSMAFCNDCGCKDGSNGCSSSGGCGLGRLGKPATSQQPAIVNAPVVVAKTQPAFMPVSYSPIGFGSAEAEEDAA